MCSPYPEFVLTNIICIGKVLKGTEIVFVLSFLTKKITFAMPGFVRYISKPNVKTIIRSSD